MQGPVELTAPWEGSPSVDCATGYGAALAGPHEGPSSSSPRAQKQHACPQVEREAVLDSSPATPLASGAKAPAGSRVPGEQGASAAPSRTSPRAVKPSGAVGSLTPPQRAGKRLCRKDQAVTHLAILRLAGSTWPQPPRHLRVCTSASSPGAFPQHASR